jgi:hypothetical protein
MIVETFKTFIISILQYLTILMRKKNINFFRKKEEFWKKRD